MWSIVLLAIIWIAGAVTANMAGIPKQIKPDEEQAKAKAFEERKFKLDALKALRESAFQRWDKRRSYEWQLSISIWTALAAFSALVLNKDSPILNNTRTAGLVALLGAFIVVGHLVYLWKMFTHTIGDAGVLRWSEREIWKLALQTDNSADQTADRKNTIPIFVLKTEKDGADSNTHFEMYPDLSRYGLAQVAITLILVCAAVLAVVSRQSFTQPPAPASTNYYFNQ